MYFQQPSLPPQANARARSAVARRATANRVRVENGGTNLGILPILAAAVPSVKTLATKAITSVISIFDPGKKRDANRKNRAQFWGDTARAGSITAARRVYGGTTMVYTVDEKKLYADQWRSVQSAQPQLAAQAVALGKLPIEEPGSDTTPMSLPPEELEALQAEIDAFHNPPSGTVTATDGKTAAAVAKSAQSSTGVIAAAAVLGALFILRKR
jgi:hypothetical protein